MVLPPIVSAEEWQPSHEALLSKEKAPRKAKRAPQPVATTTPVAEPPEVKGKAQGKSQR